MTIDGSTSPKAHMERLAAQGEIELAADGVTPLPRRGTESSSGAPVEDTTHECVVTRRSGVALDYVIMPKGEGSVG